MLVGYLVQFLSGYHKAGVGLHHYQRSPYIAAAKLLCSFVARYKGPTFTPDRVLASVIYPLVEFLLAHAAKHKSPDLSRTPATHAVYYAVFQAVAYLFCWFGAALLQPASAPISTGDSEGASRPAGPPRDCPRVEALLAKQGEYLRSSRARRALASFCGPDAAAVVVLLLKLSRLA